MIQLIHSSGVPNVRGDLVYQMSVGDVWYTKVPCIKILHFGIPICMETALPSDLTYGIPNYLVYQKILHIVCQTAIPNHPCNS